MRQLQATLYYFLNLQLWPDLLFWTRRCWGQIIGFTLPVLLLITLLLPGELPAIAAEPVSTCALQPFAGECGAKLLAQSASPVQGGSNPTVANPQAPSPIDTQMSQEKIITAKWLKFHGSLDPSIIFIVFFITLGPLKVIPVFAKLTQHADNNLRRNLAIRSAALATLVILLVALLGGSILTKWTVSLAALLLTTGILLFLASLQLVMSQYGSAASNAPPPEPSMKLLINPLTFPTILTPYGIALAIILMITNTRMLERPFIVPVMLLLVMGLNLICMLAARPILAILRPAILQVVGLVLGVMQLALGLQVILNAIQIEALTLQELLH